MLFWNSKFLFVSINAFLHLNNIIPTLLLLEIVNNLILSEIHESRLNFIPKSHFIKCLLEPYCSEATTSQSYIISFDVYCQLLSLKKY